MCLNSSSECLFPLLCRHPAARFPPMCADAKLQLRSNNCLPRGQGVRIYVHRVLRRNRRVAMVLFSSIEVDVLEIRMRLLPSLPPPLLLHLLLAQANREGIKTSSYQLH